MAPRYYNDEEIERGLLAVVLAGGSCHVAAKQLAAMGKDKAVPHSTLAGWRDRFPDRYNELRKTHLGKIEEKVIAEAYDTAIMAAEVERKAILKANEQLDADQIRDPGKLARDMSVIKGVNVDKAQVLLGRPSITVEVKSGDEIFDNLAKKFPGLFEDSIDGTATEVRQVPELEA